MAGPQKDTQQKHGFWFLVEARRKKHKKKETTNQSESIPFIRKLLRIQTTNPKTTTI